MQTHQSGGGNSLEHAESDRRWHAKSVVFCISILLAVVLTFNIVKASVNKTMPPSVFGYTPLVVLSSSMSGDRSDSFQIDDLVLVKSVNTTVLANNDVIAFYESDSIITHRIIDMKTDAAIRDKE